MGQKQQTPMVLAKLAFSAYKAYQKVIQYAVKFARAALFLASCLVQFARQRFANIKTPRVQLKVCILPLNFEVY
jgi:hypothetical protein